jgi:hypothetical protein
MMKKIKTISPRAKRERINVSKTQVFVQTQAAIAGPGYRRKLYLLLRASGLT